MSALLEIPDRLAALEQQLAALQDQVDSQQPLDTLQPTYLTVNPDGTVSADFTGTINAQGIVLPTAPTSDPGFSEIRWIKQSSGAVVATILTTSPAGEDELLINVQASAAANEVAAGMGVIDSTGTAQGLLQLLLTAGLTQITAEAGSAQVNILDSNGGSSFLQLIGLSQAALVIGSGAVLTWPGASALSNLLQINHNINRIPKIVVVACDGLSDGSGPPWPRSARTTYTNTVAKIGAKADHQPAAGVTCSVDWLAIG